MNEQWQCVTPASANCLLYSCGQEIHVMTGQPVLVMPRLSNATPINAAGSISTPRHSVSAPRERHSFCCFDT
ncbi:hypothetical protein SKAU_G00346870 [Synaphobranchus kaupii]|uniref:Uncharacterized protein n=1 Tax=Synaphobranchus kaupii TaxID=118154 RepID=A0A9Q1EJK5_SYNKA|nr:hypothetical protein SKAU_G00346870 [Synaphobranchus kaupii]